MADSFPDTVEEIEARVAELRQVERSHDFEAAASGVDELMVEVLRAIAGGAPDPQALARAALVAIDEELGDT